MEEFLKDYGLLLLLGGWFAYKTIRARQIKKQLPELQAQGAVMLDVRSVEEFAAGSAPGSINIPLSDLGGRLNEIPKNVPIVVACASGIRSGMAVISLADLFFADHGHICAFRHAQHDREVEQPDDPCRPRCRGGRVAHYPCGVAFEFAKS